MVALCILF
jgi:adenosylhomocysteinase